MAKEITRPLNEILNTTHRLLAEYVGYDKGTTSKLESTEKNIEQIQEILRKATEVVVPQVKEPPVTGEAELFQGKRILVADDDPAIRESMSLILSKDGCIVELACDGQEAVDMAKTRPDYGIWLSHSPQ